MTELCFLQIAVSCLVVVASAGWGGNQGYQGPYHIPVIGPNGVPQEPPELVAARRNHLAAFQGQPQQGPPPQQGYQQQGPPPNYGQPPAPVQPRYQGPLARIGPDGLPQYASDVAAARAAHQAAYSEVISRNANLQSQVAGHQGGWQHG